MRIWNWAFGRRLLDEPRAEQRQYAQWLRDQLNMTLLPEFDEFPDAQGPFGRTPSNPIPVNGPVGEMIYLGRLRSPHGTPYFFHRLCSVPAVLSDGRLDAYELVSTDTRHWDIVYFSMSHPRRSRRAPEKMSLVPWGSLQEVERVLLKLGKLGVNRFVDNFPVGLPEELDCDDIWSQLPDKRVAARIRSDLVREVRAQLQEYKGNWGRPHDHETRVRMVLHLESSTIVRVTPDRFWSTYA